jgi:hypothetical protein
VSLWLGGADCGDFFAGNHGCLRGTGKKRDIYGRVYRHLMENSWMIDI